MCTVNIRMQFIYVVSCETSESPMSHKRRLRKCVGRLNFMTRFSRAVFLGDYAWLCEKISFIIYISWHLCNSKAWQVFCSCDYFLEFWCIDVTYFCNDIYNTSPSFIINWAPIVYKPDNFHASFNIL